jgi:hypothetical protein
MATRLVWAVKGWATTTDNSFHSRQHLLDLVGYTWLRRHATASDGSPQNEDVALNLDLYAVAGEVADGWIFFGDSITAGAMGLLCRSPQLIADDQLHPTAEGYAAYRQLWASVMAARIYSE